MPTTLTDRPSDTDLSTAGSEEPVELRAALDNAALESEEEGDLPVAPSEKLIVQKNDRSLFELAKWNQDGTIKIDPEWQREYVWDDKRASRLIESLLIDIPIPVVYLAETSDETYEVVDGRQRLTSIFRFFDGEFNLKHLEIKADLNGLKFRDLDKKIQRKLERATLRTFELSKSTPKDLMFILFERLNTGGVALNDMEIRNSLYRGRLNNLLKELAEFPEFSNTLNVANLSRRMLDRALVLRFLAFYERPYNKIKDGLKKFLNEFLDTHRNPKEEKLEDFRRVFKGTMRACHSIFADHGFRLRKDGGTGPWTPRPNMAVFQSIAVPMAEYDP